MYLVSSLVIPHGYLAICYSNREAIITIIMRLLHLDEAGRFSLTDFSRREIPPYAILSHTWGSKDDEVTFEDMTSGTGDSKSGYNKIQFCGKQAKLDGLHYFWVDTCCIASKNEKELTTAIHSMFRWYQNAERCYVYLSDVSAPALDDHRIEWAAAFRNSLWFTRGWTLQELLAPKIVEFYSQDHVRLGDKRSLEDEIREVTGIPATALQGRHLRDFGADQRLQWADTRQTTDEEDMAYCLLGVFNLSMSPIYGEGYGKAMRLLLKKITQSIQDGLQPSGETIVV
jgi:hypothetical protein